MARILFCAKGQSNQQSRHGSSQDSALGLPKFHIFNSATRESAKIGDAVEREHWSGRAGGSLEPKTIGAVNVFEYQGWPGIWLLTGDLHISQFKIPGMADEKPVRRHGPKHVRLGIFMFELWRLQVRHGARAPAAVVEINIADLDVFDGVAGDAADDGGEPRIGVVADNIAQNDSPQLPYRPSLGPAHAAAQAQEDGRLKNLAHGNSAENNFLQRSAVHALQGNAITALKDAVGNRDVLEAAV